MLRKSFWIAALGLVLTPAVTARAEHRDHEDFPGLDAGTWELTLTGSGASNRDVNQGNFGAQASIGYFFANQLEVQGRQTIGYADTDNGHTGTTTFSASTTLAIDYHFDLDRFQPFVGAGIGYLYGKSTNDTGVFGPEAGLKYFVKHDTFIYGIVQYQFFFHNGDEFQGNFDDGSFVYGIGIGFTW
jgi:hypothetical protein